MAVGANGEVTVTIPPNTLYTITTTTGQRKGNGDGAVIPSAENFSSSLPLRYDFEGAALDSLPWFWSDMQGAFAVAVEDGASDVGGANQVVRQNAPVAPTIGGGTAATAIGDNSWAGYNISMRARIMRAGQLHLTSQ